MQNLPTKNFWSFDTGYWFEQLNSSDLGLNSIATRQSHPLSGKPQNLYSHFGKVFMLFIKQFTSPLVLLLIGAAILSIFLGDTSDVYIILFIVLSTGLLSFFQERNANRVVEKLQSIITLKSTVLRKGEQQQINSKDVASGDIIILKAGDIIPADCLVVEANELHVNEASLTGESYPVRKYPGTLQEHTELSKRTNCLWEGANIVSGSAKALAINTGADTIFGSIARSASATVETTFEKGIKDFGFFLMKITLILSLFILIVNLLAHKNIIESALFALALAVGMAPELLPAITSIAMSAGASRMLAKRVIVKKLASIQNLGEVDLLCTDKTGTITEGTIEVVGLIDAWEKDSPLVKKLAFLNASFETGYTNPIDEALKNISFETRPEAEKIGEIPYDFIRKRLSIAVKVDAEKTLICKGAFKQILSICTKVVLPDGNIESISSYQPAIESKFEQFGIDGLRVIGICYKNITAESILMDDEKEMIFAGFIVFEDPVKIGITETIDELKKLQVDLKIITGDNKNVAKSIGSKIGIINPVVLTGQEIFNTSPEALKLLVKQTHIFAEVEPQQKERILQALRKSYTVAYIGDGINDVSAITAADVGISVENAVDVAREAADFVLMEKDLMVVVDGIKEGRKTFANTLKYIYISTGSTFGNMFSVAVASLILPFLPMLPQQILLTNFITDFPYLTIASDNVDKEQLEKPGKWNLKIISRYMVIFGIHSSIFDLITFLTLLFVLKVKESAFQTGWFIESSLSELFILFIIRTHKNFFKSQPAKYLFILSIIGLVVTLGLPYSPFANDLGLVPLPLVSLGAIVSILAVYIITADLLKVWFFKRYRKI